jgi:tripartite-type tricarboxylate transporter receptor subunit TctC
MPIACEVSTQFALPLPLQGERVGVRGRLHELRARGETPSSRPSPPEGGEGAHTLCSPNIRFLLQRALGTICLTFILALSLTPAHAETYPARPIRVVVSTAAGGITDICARVVGHLITTRTGQTIVIDNKPGGSGNIGMEFVSRATPDGYTLGVANTGQIVINPFLYAHMSYNPLHDLAPVGSIGEVPLFIVVSGKLPVHSLQEFIAYAKARPGKLSYASAGSGTTPHLVADAFFRRTGLDLVHVPYRGAMPGVMDVIAGRMQATFVSMGPYMDFVRRGDLRILGVAAERRVPYLPDVPTFAEQGVPDFIANTWFAMFAPRGTPPAILEQLNGYIRAVASDPDARGRLDATFIEPTPLSLADFTQLVTADAAKWKNIVRDAGVRGD